MTPYKKPGLILLALVLTVLCASCKGETLFFNKHIEINNENYGTNLEFYEGCDTFLTDAGEPVQVSLKTFLEKHPQTGNCRLSLNFGLSGFEANQSVKVKNANLLLNVDHATLASCEVYDLQKTSQNFYGTTTSFGHHFQTTLDIKDSYLVAYFNLSGDPEAVDITIEFTYDLMDFNTTVKGCKIVQTI